MVLTFFLVFAIERGVRFSFSVFFVALLNEFHWSRATTAGALSLFLIVMHFLSPAVGLMIERSGIRKTMVLGLAIASASLVLLTFTASALQFYLFLGVGMAAGCSALSGTGPFVLLSRWFRRRLGLASGLAFSGSAIGYFIFMPLSQYFISTLGWRGAYSALAVIYLVFLLPPILFLMQESPEEMDLEPDGQSPRRTPSEEVLRAPMKESETSEGWTMREVLATRVFWGIFLSRVFTPMAVLMLLTHHVAYVVELGFSPAHVTFLLGMSGLLAAPSMIGFGHLSDRIGRVLAVTITFLLFIAAAVMLLFLKDPSQVWLLYLYVVFFGLGFGGRGVIVSAMAADVFGGKRFPVIYGAMNLAFGIGGPIGPWLGGYIYDRTGSYQLAFILSIVFMMLATLSIFLAASGGSAGKRRT